MKSFIKIENPCTESWENMHPISGGRFCDLCNKKVLDLTNLSDAEILQILENSHGQICGRVLKNQLKKPFYNEYPHEKPIYKTKFNYSKIATGIALATSLTSIQANQFPKINNQLQINSSKNYVQENELKENEKIVDNDFVVSGRLINKETQKPIANAKITLVTLEKIFSVVSDSDGNFSMNVPEILINKKKNVLHFEFMSGNDTDRIYKREELIKGNFEFTNEEELDIVVLAGGISRIKKIPTVFIDGDEIEYNELEDYDYKKYKTFFYHGELAKAIYSDASDDGLILRFSK